LLRERPFARLLTQVFRKRITGRLVVTDDSGDVTCVYLREGLPVHAERAADIDRLDLILVSSGLITATVAAEADAEVRRTGRRLGEVLVARGRITPDALAEVLKKQLRRKVTRLFFAQQGSFEIYIEPHPHGEGDDFALMRVDPHSFVYRGIKFAYDDERLRSELVPLTGYRFKMINIPPAALEEMGIPADDPTLAALRDRSLTLEDVPVNGAKPLESRGLVLALLYSDLLDTAAVSVRTPAGIPAAASQDPPPAPVVIDHERRPSTAMPVVTAAAPNATSRAAADCSTVRRPTPAPVSPTDALRNAIVDLNQKLDHGSHFEILGVPENATLDEVNGMYMRALRVYHVDRLAAAGLSELAPQAERVMARMGEAVSVLRDPKRRAEYVATRAGKRPEPAAPVSIADADKSFQKGEVFLRKGDYTHAIECFSEAIKANPSEHQYRAYLAWARFDDPRARKEVLAREVLGTLQQVVASQPRFARGFYWIGQIWKYLNDPNQAEKAFREALKLDRAMLDAEREIRLLEMRKAARAQTTKAPQTATARQSSGLLGKLLKSSG